MLVLKALLLGLLVFCDAFSTPPPKPDATTNDAISATESHVREKRYGYGYGYGGGGYYGGGYSGGYYGGGYPMYGGGFPMYGGWGYRRRWWKPWRPWRPWGYGGW